MSHRSRPLAALMVLILLVAARGAGAEPLFTLGDEGRTFLYRARPGDTPTAVAAMFGIPEEQLAAFLAANGIRDATRVGSGFVYRIPNDAARALSGRTTTLVADNARLTRELADVRTRAEQLARDTEAARTGASQAEGRAARLARVGALWPYLQVMLVLLVIVAAAAGAMARAAIRRKSVAERYARNLAQELEEKRRGALMDRQESARRILELETRVRTLEAQIGRRAAVSGRS